MVLERRISMLAKVDVFEIVLCATLSLAGLMLEGLRGAVAGQALGSLATLVLSGWLAHRYLGFNWPWRDTFKICIATGVMLLALFLLHARKDALGLGLAAVVGALVYGAAIALLFAPQWRRLLAANRT